MRNMILLASLFSICLVIYFGIIAGHNLNFFFNAHAIVLVLGGTLAVFVLSTPPSNIKSLYKIFKYLVFGDLNQNKVKLIKSLHRVAEKRYTTSSSVTMDLSLHPFLVDVISVLNLKDISSDKIERIINEKINVTIKNYEIDSEILANLGKYPPAMGLLGATTGIIGMMKNLGQADKSAIGMYMASALVATIWGIGLSNFLILPFSDLIHQLNKEAVAHRKMIAESMLMSYRKEHPDHVLEYLITYLPISIQHDLRVELKNKGTAAA